MSDMTMGDLVAQIPNEGDSVQFGNTVATNMGELAEVPEPVPLLDEAVAEVAAGAVMIRGTGKKKVEYRFDAQAGLFLDKNGNPPPASKRPTLPNTRREDFKLDTRSVFEKDRSMLGATATLDGDGFLVDNAGKKSYSLKPRRVFRRGTYFRVVREGIWMEAMCFYGKNANGKPLWSGWSRALPVGTIVECIGWRRFRRESSVAPQFIYPELPAEAKYSTVWPKDSVFRPWPMDGILRPMTAEEAAEYKTAQEARNA